MEQIKYYRYRGEVKLGSVWSAPNNDGSKYRRIRIVAEHIDGGWIYEDLPSTLYPRGDRGMNRCPDLNLRIIFKPEDNNAN